MKKPSFQLALTATLATIGLTVFIPLHAAEAERREHKELPAEAGGTLTFKSCIGGINIRTRDQDAVTYDAVIQPGNGASKKAEKLMDLLEFSYTAADSNVTITMKWKDDHQPHKYNLGVRHTLLIPARYNVDVRTSGGDVRGEDIGGQVLVRTSGGGIRFGNVNGSVDARTSGGGITLDHIKGDARVETSGGGITVGEVTGELRGSTSGGSIRATLGNQIQKPLALSTSGGSIRLAVPNDFKADFRASTSGGSVNCGLPLDGSVKRESVKGRLNGGGPEVRLSTSGGNIELAKR